LHDFTNPAGGSTCQEGERKMRHSERTMANLA
jgi:hypothetical protein